MTIRDLKYDELIKRCNELKIVGIDCYGNITITLIGSVGEVFLQICRLKESNKFTYSKILSQYLDGNTLVINIKDSRIF